MTADIPRRRRGLPTDRELVDLAADARVNRPPDWLDLVHITSVGWGRRIVSAAKIEPRRCEVFSRDLVYAFMARPAYRFRDGDLKSDQISRFPFVFVISPGQLEVPFHVYPFDTGAAAAGLYGDTAQPTVFLEDYALDPSIAAAMQHIAWAFGSNAAYFEGILKPGLANSLPYWRSVGRGWIDIAGLAAIGADRPDARASAIEVAYKSSIDLRQGHIRLAIFPQQLIEDDRGNNAKFLAELEKLGLTIKTYDWRPNETPDSFMDDITRIVRCHLEETEQL
jgi:hypothetical protein